jgi:hypothetical protein
MTSTSYHNCLSPAIYDGLVGTIRVRWAKAGVAQLQGLARSSGAPLETLKALSEHAAYASAYRLQNNQVVIRYEKLTQLSITNSTLILYKCPCLPNEF